MTDFNYIGAGPRLDTLTGTYSYDTADRLTGLDYTSNGGQTAIDNYRWAYNAGNLVTSFTTDSGTASYAYDATNQITTANYSGTNQPANESYSYDPNGNRDMAGYSTAADNIVASDGTFNYQHDADGNITVRTRISDATPMTAKHAVLAALSIALWAQLGVAIGQTGGGKTSARKPVRIQEAETANVGTTESVLHGVTGREEFCYLMKK